MNNVVDISKVIIKLQKAGIIAPKLDESFDFIFSIKKHGHLLERDELKAWVDLLHKSLPHPNEECTDEHRVKFQPFSD